LHVSFLDNEYFEEIPLHKVHTNLKLQKLLE